MMQIWIDLSNSPHVLFFRSIIQMLENQGHNVRITARDFAQTIALAGKYGLNYEIIGTHAGGSLWRKGLKLFDRTFTLMTWAYRQNIDIAVSHNTYSQAVAAFLLRIPFVAIEDYEHQPAHHLSFRLARRVIVPEVFPENALRLYGATERKVKRYPGSKEQVYLSCFTPNATFLSEQGLDNGKIIVTVRPPATFALYHRFENPLFMELLEWLTKQDDVLLVLLPRTNDQKEFFLVGKYRNIFIPCRALDGPNLLFHSDLVISAGGTMNREAAVLGTPVYTIFAGQAAAVDDYFVRAGRMVSIQDKADFAKIKLCKKTQKKPLFIEQSALGKIVDFINDVPGIGARTFI